TKIKNSQGQLVKVIDPQNNSLTYQYDAIGNLIATTDPKGNIVSLSYDLRGRKTQMVDPDMGTWIYEYNAFGELTKQTDAKGQVTSMVYDKLGRMISRAEADLVSSWTYDNCTKGIGKLCSSTADNGYLKSNTYDSLGRGSSTTTTIDTTYTSSATYDANGRINTVTYPTGLTVQYVYTTLGYLKEVRNSQTNALLWRADTQNALGQLLQQTYGNNVVTQQVFEATTGRLKNIYAGAGNNVQNFSYAYDYLGNLVSRTDGNQNLTETFLYDSLNRLTNAVVNSPAAGLSSTNYTFDNLGNITNRSDMGTYAYGNANDKPHGLKELNFINGGKLQYSYDANGALISEVAIDSTGQVIANRGRNEVYTSFGMPQAIGAPGISLAFAYGPEHQRVKQIAPAATTIYLHPDNTGGLFYEKDIKTDGTIEHKQYITAGGQVIALIKLVGSTQTIRYMHRDQLGSTTTITDEQGNAIERLAYEPFGKRRFPAGNTDNAGEIVGQNTDRGFTNHEHLEELGLIHMNGRIYDPAIGRFMSADPYIQASDNIQSYNRYAYVFNNPLNSTDPTGYFSLGGFIGGGVLGGIVGSNNGVLGQAGRAIELGIKSAVIPTQKNQFDFQHSLPGQARVDTFIMNNKWAYMIGMAVATYYGGPTAAAHWASYYAYQGTGSMSAAYKSGAIAYVSASVTQQIAPDASALSTIVTKATVSGVAARLQGDSFMDGFRQAALFALASEGYKEFVGWRASLASGENHPDLTLDPTVKGANTYEPDITRDGRIPLSAQRMNLFGINENLNGDGDFGKQSGPLSRFMNRIPGMNAVAAIHDTIFTRGYIQSFNVFTNYGTMLPAAAFSFTAVIGNNPIYRKSCIRCE
ncbi:RHS repeat-associated core domain protein containing protein, partial [Herbaspirillum sp. CF444]|uniref:RHS repeat-associated core domain-containing protein n=1 Tax=Herbaspirillum sp. CF444 TaxID=1144319 RepID=UPI0002723FF8